MSIVPFQSKMCFSSQVAGLKKGSKERKSEVNWNSFCTKVQYVLPVSIKKYFSVANTHTFTETHTHTPLTPWSANTQYCSCVTANTCYCAFALWAYCNGLYRIFPWTQYKLAPVSTNVFAQKVGGRYNFKLKCQDGLYRIIAKTQQPLYQYTLTGVGTDSLDINQSLEEKDTNTHTHSSD